MGISHWHIPAPKHPNSNFPREAHNISSWNITRKEWTHGLTTEEQRTKTDPANERSLEAIFITMFDKCRNLSLLKKRNSTPSVLSCTLAQKVKEGLADHQRATGQGKPALKTKACWLLNYKTKVIESQSSGLTQLPWFINLLILWCSSNPWETISKVCSWSNKKSSHSKIQEMMSDLPWPSERDFSKGQFHNS